MAENPLSVAWIQVRADTSKVRADVESETARAGKQAGENLGKGLSGGVRTGMAQAATEARTGAGKVSSTVQGGLIAGFKEGSREVIAEADSTGTKAASGIRGALQRGLRGYVEDAGKAGAEAGNELGKQTERTAKEHTTRVGETIKEGLKASLVGLSAGFLGLGAIEVFKSFLEGAAEARKASALTEAVIKSTGGAAHVTGEEVDKLALALSNKAGVDDDVIHSGENVLLTFTNVRNEAGKGNDVFNRATQAALDYSVATGRDMVGASRLLGRALNDPIAGMSLLRRAGIQFTDEQKAQITTLVKTGHTVQAQGIILDAFGKRFGGAAEAAATPLQKLQVRIENLGKQLAGYLLPIVDKVATFTGDVLLPAVAGIGHVLTVIPGPVYAAAAAFVALRLAMSVTLGTIEKIGKSGGALAGLRSGIGNVIGLLGGPWGLAFTGAALLVGRWAQTQQDAKQREDDLRDSLDKTTGAYTRQTRVLIAQSLQQSGVVAAARQLGISLGDLQLAAEGNADAQARVNSVTSQYSTHSSVYGAAVTRNANALSSQQQAARKVTGAIGGQNQALNDAVKSWHASSDATGEVNTLLGENAGKVKTARQLYDQARAALVKWNDTMQAQADQFLQGRQTERAYKDAIAAATQAVKDNGRTLNDNTVKGRANEAAVDAVTSSGRAYIKYLVDSKAPGRDVRAEWETQRRKLLDVYLQFVGNKSKALDYVNNALGKVPPKVSTAVETPGLTAAQRAFRNFQAQVLGLKGTHIGIAVTTSGVVTTALAAQAAAKRRGLAGGGRVTGPGTETSDSVPAMLSKNEHVWTAREVAAAGGHAAVEAMRSGVLRGYAAGGRVMPINASVSTTNIPVPGNALQSYLNSYGSAAADLARKYVTSVINSGFGLAGINPGGSGVTRWAPTILRALAMLGQSPSWLGVVESRMNRESGGNPTIVNRWDSNWIAGHPSVGLMQVIAGTFARWAGPFRNTGPFSYGVSTNGLANTYAGLNYALHNYGTLGALSKPGGYDAGGLATTAGLLAKMTTKPERVLSPGQTEAFERAMSRGFGGNISVRVYLDGQEITGRVQVAVDDAFGEFGRRLGYGYGEAS